jgi:hypothetical protein
MTAENVAAFPPAKPTIVEIMDDGMKTGQPLVVVYEKIAKFYPKKSLTEIKAAVSSELDRMEMEAAKLPAMPVEKVAALPQSRAAKRRFRENFWEDFRAAVALDPDWDWYPGALWPSGSNSGVIGDGSFSTAAGPYRHDECRQCPVDPRSQRPK